MAVRDRSWLQGSGLELVAALSVLGLLRACRGHCNVIARGHRDEDSLSELNQQLQQHPSILPVDFDITNCGDLVLNVPPPVDIYDTAFDREYHQNNHEFEDQRVPVAKLSHSSSGDTSSPQITSPSLAPEDVALPPITTPTYALEFQKAIEASSQGRDVLTVQVGSVFPLVC
uniref:Uncharacterized protein n=1 Tax=Timema poppense TaxID=170557 RepID=A0A7R9H4H0_TIMPO|nr:unnamed protein product [Timema poppensis]